MTKILLVEDDKSLREIYGVRLLAEGYDIVSAGDGEEALAMAIKERPVLIVSDVMMPKISGFDMLDILRSTTETKDIKVIMMTALSSEDQRERGEKLGADRYLVKSQVGIEDVVRTVHEVLGDVPGLASAPTTAPQPAVATFAPSPQAIPQPVPVPPVPQPAAPVMPQSTPTPAPVQQPYPQIPQPSPTQPVAPQMSAPGSLPQPTAPFSSNVPRPTGLGDRVIQPIETTATSSEDIALKMQRELSDEPAFIATPAAPTASQPVTAPQPQSIPTPPQAILQPTPMAPAPQQNPATPLQPVPSPEQHSGQFPTPPAE